MHFFRKFFHFHRCNFHATNFQLFRKVFRPFSWLGTEKYCGFSYVYCLFGTWRLVEVHLATSLRYVLDNVDRICPSLIGKFTVQTLEPFAISLVVAEVSWHQKELETRFYLSVRVSLELCLQSLERAVLCVTGRQEWAIWKFVVQSIQRTIQIGVKFSCTTANRTNWG